MIGKSAPFYHPYGPSCNQPSQDPLRLVSYIFLIFSWGHSIVILEKVDYYMSGIFYIFLYYFLYGIFYVMFYVFGTDPGDSSLAVDNAFKFMMVKVGSDFLRFYTWKSFWI